MKIISSLLTLSFFGLFISCGPAAEDRVQSDARNKVIQDSMVNYLKTKIDEPLKIINNGQAALQPINNIIDTTKK
jgi:hypothetical protein